MNLFLQLLTDRPQRLQSIDLYLFHLLNQTYFPQFDVIIAIRLLKKVYSQKHQPTVSKTCAYEMIIWKNNHKTQQDVVSITALFVKESNIQSSKNCYCILRLAVASWMKNDLKVCDNGIIEPSPGCVQI